MPGKKRILIVDDEIDMVEILRMRLEANGYDVIGASDGQSGLEAAKKEKPDLIVLDLMLPKLDGYRICGLLKKDSRFSKIPIIIFSAHTQDKDRKRAEEMGADSYIAKPFEPHVLLEKIEELLKK